MLSFSDFGLYHLYIIHLSRTSFGLGKLTDEFRDRRYHEEYNIFPNSSLFKHSSCC